MIDNRLLLTDFELCRQKLARKGVAKEELAKTQQMIIQKNKSIEQVEQLRSRKNKLSRNIAELMKEKKKEQVEEAKNQVSQLKKEMEKEEKALSQLEGDLENRLLNLPNFPDNKAPDGNSSKDNVEVLRENFDSDRFNSEDFFAPLGDHGGAGYF